MTFKACALSNVIFIAVTLIGLIYPMLNLLNAALSSKAVLKDADLIMLTYVIRALSSVDCPCRALSAQVVWA